MSNFDSIKTQIQSLIDSANAKTGKTDTNLTNGVNSLIEGYGVGGLEPVEHSWNQIPTAVKNFLDNVTYNPSDYSTSRIAEFAPVTAYMNNTLPIGIAVETSAGVLDREGYETAVTDGNTTVYNDIPNKYTEYVVRNGGVVSQVGTLKPTGFLRQIKSAVAENVRDLGGWACDGGTVKYGKLFRGGEINAYDRDVLVNQCGIRHELNLRSKAEANRTKSPLGDDIGFTCPENYVWMSISDKTTWKEILSCIFECVTKNEPVYFHCAAGADRTGTVACIIEAILGMSQSDIDKDYELTCFYTGVGTDAQARRRNETEWQGMISAINSLTVGATFRDKVLNWVASMGFTVDEINSFRTAMINGTPDTISLDIDSCSITNTLTNVISNNKETTITQYQPYEAEISVPNGYVIEDITVTMGGVDITASVFKGTKTNLNRAITSELTGCVLTGKKVVIDGQDFVASLTAIADYTMEGASVNITMGGIDVSTYYSDGKIAIPNVTGDIVITANAVSTAVQNFIDGNNKVYYFGTNSFTETDNAAFGYVEDDGTFVTVQNRGYNVVGFSNDALLSLPAGTYVYSGEFKQDKGAASAIMIYNGGTRVLKNSLNASNWTAFSYEFTLTATGQIYFCAQNDDSTGGKAYLRNASIVAK